MFLEQRFSLVVYHFLNYQKKHYKKLVKKYGKKLIKILEEIAEEATFTYCQEKTTTRKFLIEQAEHKDFAIYDEMMRYIKSFY